MNEIHPTFHVTVMSRRDDAEEIVERRIYIVTDHTSFWEVRTSRA
jgi:hypothetical protein